MFNRIKMHLVSHFSIIFQRSLNDPVPGSYEVLAVVNCKMTIALVIFLGSRKLSTYRSLRVSPAICGRL